MKTGKPKICSSYIRFSRFLKYKIIHANDSPHRIALGIAMGLFIAWMPALGLHMLLVLSLTFLIRANKFVAVMCVWISNPFTIIPIYYPNYLLGRIIMSPFRIEPLLSSAQITEIFNQFSPSAVITGFYQMQFWKNVFALFLKIGPELWLGSIIAGLIIAVTAYLVTNRIIVIHRKKNPHRRFRHHI